MIEESEKEDECEMNIFDHPVTNVAAAELRVEMFVVVNFVYNKNTKKETNKKFAAQIKNVNGYNYVVKCMRESAKRKAPSFFQMKTIFV